MMAHILRLESLKQRSLFLSLSLIFAATLFMGFLRQLVARQDIVEGLAGIFLLLAICAIPFLAAALPASAGASLRQKSTRLIEEALPIHPREHFLAAYLISLIHFVLLGGLIAFGAIRTGSLFGTTALVDEFVVLLIALLQVHVLAFAIAYISKQPFIGGISALAICLLQLSFFFVYLPYRISWNMYMHSDVNLMINLIATLPSILFLVCVLFLTKRIEREAMPGIPALIGLVFLLFAGPSILFGYITFNAYQLNSELKPVFDFRRILNIEANLKRGTILGTGTGNLIRILPDHNRIVLSRDFESADATYAPDGSVWVLTKSAQKNNYVIRVERNGVLHDFTRFRSEKIFPERILMVDSNAFIFGEDAEHNRFFAILSQAGLRPDWKKSTDLNQQPWGSNEVFNFLIQKGAAAYASSDLRSLIHKRPDGTIESWSLPGEAQAASSQLNFYPVAFQTDQGSGFLLSVKDENSQRRLIRCLPDGKVDEPWPGVRLNGFVALQKLANNGFAFRQYESRTVYLIDAKGNAFPPLDISAFEKEEYPGLRRLDGNDLWIISQTKFLRFNLKTGSYKLLVKVDPRSEFSMEPAVEGMYFVLKGKIWLLDWNGKQQYIGSARMD